MGCRAALRCFFAPFFGGFFFFFVVLSLSLSRIFLRAIDEGERGAGIGLFFWCSFSMLLCAMCLDWHSVHQCPSLEPRREFGVDFLHILSLACLAFTAGLHPSGRPIGWPVFAWIDLEVYQANSLPQVTICVWRGMHCLSIQFGLVLVFLRGSF
jgi:hypothetical protein